MGLFERWFRAQFTPHEGAYRFDHGGGQHAFDRDEVEHFVAEWRRHWANPLIWFGWLVLGVALPAWLYYQGYWGIAFVIATVAGIAMAVNLVFPLRQPHEVAAGRAPLKEKAPWQPPTGLNVLGTFAFAAAFALFAWYLHRPSRSWLDSADIVPVFAALHMLWMAMVQFVL